MPTSTTSGARLVTFSLPSFFAAVTSASIPPLPAAEVAVPHVLAVLPPPVDPHAAESRVMIPRTRPKRWIRCQFIPLAPHLYWPVTAWTPRAQVCSRHDAPSTMLLQGAHGADAS